VEAIEHALSELGYSSARIPFTKDIGAVLRKLTEEGDAAVAINLCESVDEDPKYVGHPAAVLELLDIQFTGSPSPALMLTTDKLLSKRLLAASGIDTPGFQAYEGADMPDLEKLAFPVIVKPRFQDASIGIDQDSVFRDRETLLTKLGFLYADYGDLVIEEYISGREFNISLFGYPHPQVLPIAEIVFNQFPPELFRIVGYRAKWDETSFEYRHTPRIFPALSPAFQKRLQDTALASFGLFMLRDYARVDVRVDERDNIYVLEVNANPCLSPDAGFAAAAGRGGIAYKSLVEQLLNFVRKRISQ